MQPARPADAGSSLLCPFSTLQYVSKKTWVAKKHVKAGCFDVICWVSVPITHNPVADKPGFASETPMKSRYTQSPGNPPDN